MDESINDNFDEETCATLRKRVLDLEASESYLRVIFDSVNDAIFVHDTATGAILDVNQRACELWGYTKEEILRIGVGDLSCGDPPYTERNARKLIKKAGGGAPQLAEWQCRDSKGRRFWVEVSLRRAASAEGNRVLVVARDTTERKRSQEALQASYDRLQMAQEAARIGTFEWRVETGKAIWSREVEALYGLAPGTFEGTLDGWLRRIHPEDREMAANDLAEAMKTGLHHVAFRVIWPDGSIHWLEARGRVYFDEQGNPVRMLGMNTDITERKRAEEALRESEKRYRDVVELIPAGIVVHSDFTILYVNPASVAAARVRSANEMVGRPIWDFIAPDWWEVYRDRYTKLLRGEEQPILTEGTLMDAEGNRVDIEGTARLIEYSGKTAILSTFRDITKRKRAEEALHKSQRTLSHIINTIPQSIFWKDRNSVYLGCNEVFVRAVGLASPDEIVGKTDYDLPWPKEEADAYVADDREVMNSNQPKRHIIEPLQQADGSRLWIDTTKIPMHDEQGNVTGVLGVYEDITERKQMQEALQETSRMLRLVMDTIPARVFWKDRNSTFLGCNRLLAEDIGVQSPEEIVGKTDYDISSRDRAELYRADDRAVMESGVPNIGYDEQVRTAKGQDMWVQTNKIPLRGANGEIIGVLGTYEDITQRKRAEEALVRRSHQLEVLSNTSRQLNAVLEIPVVLSTLVASALELVEAQGGAAGLLVGDKMVFTEYNRAGQKIPINYAFELGAGVPGHVMQTKAPYRCRDAACDPFVVQGIREALDFHSLVDVPILSRSGELLGCFEIHNKSGQREFDEDDVAMLEGLAASAAVALENAHILADRTAAQEALEQSTKMLRLVLDNIPAWVFWKDRNGTFLGCNRLFAANAGLASPEDIVGKNDFDMPWKDTEAASYRRDDRYVIETGEPKLDYEESQKTADGTTMWVRTSKVPLRGPRGNIVGVLGSFEDITEQKRVEQEKRAFYRQTIMAATNGKLEICDETDVEPYLASPLPRHDVCAPEDVAYARRDIENFCRDAGLNQEALGMFVIAVGEAITNAVKHAPRGCVIAGKSKNEVWVAVADNGPGIESLILPNAVLRRGFSTKPSLGLGYSIMLDAADRIMLKTDNTGTTVVLFKTIHEVGTSLDIVPDTWEGIPHSM